MQLAILSGLQSAIEIHILEESRETMRVGDLGWGLWTRNFVWLRCGLIHKPKNVTTISYALSSQNCDGVDLRKKKKKKQDQTRQQNQSSLFSAGFKSKKSSYLINSSDWEYIIRHQLFSRS